MEKTISNIEELKDFLREHYNTLTFDQYSNLIRSTLDVIVLNMPNDVNVALEEITEYWNKFGSLPPDTERPFFLLQNEPVFNFIEDMPRILKH